MIKDKSGFFVPLDCRVAFDVSDVELARQVFQHELTEQDGEYYYARRSQPTTEAMLDRIKEIQAANFGVATASGMAAADLTINTLMAPGQTLVYGSGIYYEIDQLIQKRSAMLGFNAVKCDTHDLAQVEHALAKHETGLIWVETPENPLLAISDIAAIRRLRDRLARQALIVVDNSALPLFQRSLLHGADIELISLTKYVNGTGDIMGGVLLTQDGAVAEKLRGMLDLTGGVMSHQDAFKVIRNLATLHLRLAWHCQSALTIAQRLESHPALRSLHYPALEATCKGYSSSILKTQMGGMGGGLIALRLAGGYAAGDKLMHMIVAQRQAKRNSVLYIIPTFGTPATHVEHYHSFMRLREGIPREETSEGKIPPGFCRLAVGLCSPVQVLEELEPMLTQLEREFDPRRG